MIPNSLPESRSRPSAFLLYILHLDRQQMALTGSQLLNIHRCKAVIEIDFRIPLPFLGWYSNSNRYCPFQFVPKRCILHPPFTNPERCDAKLPTTHRNARETPLRKCKLTGRKPMTRTEHGDPLIGPPLIEGVVFSFFCIPRTLGTIATGQPSQSFQGEHHQYAPFIVFLAPEGLRLCRGHHGTDGGPEGS